MSKSENPRMVKTLLTAASTFVKSEDEIDDFTPKRPMKLSKKSINVFRTTSRNNIELTSIADNKANILLSLNALMITFLVPSVIANWEIVVDKMLYIPVIVFLFTCTATMYMSAQVLKPFDFDKLGERIKTGNPSPFFFGNFFKMQYSEFYEFMEDSVDKKELLSHHLVQDLYYLGKRLGEKMTTIRRAFSLFVGGIFFTLFLTLLILAFQ